MIVECNEIYFHCFVFNLSLQSQHTKFSQISFTFFLMHSFINAVIHQCATEKTTHLDDEDTQYGDAAEVDDVSYFQEFVDIGFLAVSVLVEYGRTHVGHQVGIWR